MADVFISYKREDRLHANRLAEALKQAGYEVWFDHELISGDQFRNVIRRMIDHSSAVIVIWSKRSVLSEFVLDEATYAKSLGKLCPIRIDDVMLPFGFGQIHTDNLIDWTGAGDDVEFGRVIRAVAAKVEFDPHSGLPTKRSMSGAGELEAFQAAIATKTTSALLAFADRFPDGELAGIARARYSEMRSPWKRTKALSFWPRAALAAGAATVAAGLIWLVIAKVVDSKVPVTVDTIEPLTEAQLTALVKDALDSIGKGSCPDEKMEAALLAACKQHVGPMAAAIQALGPIVNARSQGRIRSAASGGALRTVVDVTFEKGTQRWEVLGSSRGRLATFWSNLNQ